MKSRAVTPVGDEELRHGYTATALHQLTKLAANTAKAWLSMDYTDLMEAAWFGIVEHLYTSDEWPPRYDLVRAGQDAIHRLVAGEMHHHGYNKAKSAGGAYNGPASSSVFIRFWTNPHPDSPERRIVERTALQQIMPRLSPGQREAIYALAVHDDYLAAARAIGQSYEGFKSQVSKGRRRFLELWHEGEEPSKQWGTDRRVAVHGKELATHCGRGHEWTPENTIHRTYKRAGKPSKSRVCRACQKLRGEQRTQAERERRARGDAA
jgi:hypothetical protein